ncbi:MAG: RNA 2',3'-cyclic phosphodiesterase [Candidatus Aenigmatarchaeota archaeon]
MVRCFVGYLLPEDIKEEIVELQNKIKKWPIVCKMVEKENLHLNFSFLGEIQESQIKEIYEKIDVVGKKFKKFEVKIGGMKAIPSDKYIRVIVLDVFDETNNLKSLFDEINKNIKGDSKPAHITLCRVKSIKNKHEVRKFIFEENKPHGKFVINAIQLIKSELKKTGPIYSILHQTELS